MGTPQNKQVGVLLHISSLPAGDLGADAYRFVNWLASTGVSVWQTLPINMTHDDGSPYQAVSAHAGNPGFISVQMLVDWGWCEAEALTQPREQAFKATYECYQSQGDTTEFEQFCQSHQGWLDNFACFLSLRETHNKQSWADWPASYKLREKDSLARYISAHQPQIALIKFIQFVFFKQWDALKAYANARGITLFGDIPIFVAYDSADVWAEPSRFKLDDTMKPTVVAGVPPDYFSATGQRWGNPHYDWDVMQRDGFAWWLARIHTQAQCFDWLRIDHFRGLQAAWEIPADEPTAMNGDWVEAPGDALLNTIQTHYPNLKLIAEDLGIITDEVDALRLKYRLPGMKILQFAFGGDQSNPYLPENIDPDSVTYTGTHDNDTTLGWYQTLDAEAKAHFHQYLNAESPIMPTALIQMALNTQSHLVVIPMQDVLHLDGTARMNVPGTCEDNWCWAMQWSQLSDALREGFKQQVVMSGRYHG